MKKYEFVGIGVAIGLLFGVIYWFIHQQITWVYAQATQQRLGIEILYNADDVAFYTALSCAIIAFVLIFFRQKIYNKVEAWAIKNRSLIIRGDEEENEEEDNENNYGDDYEDEFYNGEEVDRI
jgi:ABC-type long-subunit fatty acid transport system fused permease/ATPase subunit